jgi:hypothetical protein
LNTSFYNRQKYIYRQVIRFENLIKLWSGRNWWMLKDYSKKKITHFFQVYVNLILYSIHFKLSIIIFSLLLCITEFLRVFLLFFRVFWFSLFCDGDNYYCKEMIGATTRCYYCFYRKNVSELFVVYILFSCEINSKNTHVFTEIWDIKWKNPNMGGS